MLICGQKNSVEKKAVNLRKQAVITKCRGYINAEPKAVSLKKQWISVPKKSVIITISLDIKKNL